MVGEDTDYGLKQKENYIQSRRNQVMIRVKKMIL